MMVSRQYRLVDPSRGPVEAVSVRYNLQPIDVISFVISCVPSKVHILSSLSDCFNSSSYLADQKTGF